VKVVVMNDAIYSGVNMCEIKCVCVSLDWVVTQSYRAASHQSI